MNTPPTQEPLFPPVPGMGLPDPVPEVCARCRDRGLIVDVANGAVAVFDPGRQYRYLLARVWNPHRPLIGWTLLNQPEDAAPA